MPLLAYTPTRKDHGMSLKDFFASLVRTVTPVVVGLVASGLLLAGVEVDEAALELTISGVLIGAYYAIVRALESRFPVLGVLLGWKATPHYDDES